jgi:hypothetical protein
VPPKKIGSTPIIFDDALRRAAVFDKNKLFAAKKKNGVVLGSPGKIKVSRSHGILTTIKLIFPLQVI